MKKTMTLLVLLITVVLAGCNTIRGAGKDIEDGGKAIQKSTE
jgi:predicted small secreted protein